MVTTAPVLHVAGVTDEQTTCDACGRVELRRTVIVADADGIEVGRYGTSCAGRLLGRRLTAAGVDQAEAARRANVVHELRAARAERDRGMHREAAWRVYELRKFVHYFRPDEASAMADLDAISGTWERESGATTYRPTPVPTLA